LEVVAVRMLAILLSVQLAETVDLAVEAEHHQVVQLQEELALPVKATMGAVTVALLLPLFQREEAVARAQQVAP